jgi:hypothetical protein
MVGGQAWSIAARRSSFLTVRSSSRNRTPPSLAPNPGSGSVSQARASTGSANSARNVAPRWPLTMNRKPSGTAAIQAAIRSGLGRA